jgi:hypothetical protein
MIIAICLMVSFLSQSSLAAEPKLTNRIVRAFQATFSEAEDAQWSEVEDLLNVNFTLNGRRMFAFYNVHGDLVVTGRYLSVKQLPKVAQQKLTVEANGLTISETFEISEGVDTRYYATIDNGHELRVVVSTGGKWSTYRKISK